MLANEQRIKLSRLFGETRRPVDGIRFAVENERDGCKLQVFIGYANTSITSR